MSDSDDRGGDTGSDRPGAEESKLSRRLDALGHELDRRRPAPATEEGKAPRQGSALALRLASDFIAGVLLGVALGWGFDRLFGTAPFGLVVFVLLGFAAGILSMMRSAGLVAPGPAKADDVGDRL